MGSTSWTSVFTSFFLFVGRESLETWEDWEVSVLRAHDLEFSSNQQKYYEKKETVILKNNSRFIYNGLLYYSQHIYDKSSKCLSFVSEETS